MSPRLYDAHNHLQDNRLIGIADEALAAAKRQGLAAMVVNGSSEEDWPAVLELSKRYPEIIPSFGYHPWYVKEQTEQWLLKLRFHLAAVPSGIGEIGLDRWITDYDLRAQEDSFLSQMTLATEWNLPASIHCLKAWGRLYELLKEHPRPECGFVLHSFGGPAEMIPALAKLGAYFSLPGYFAHPRKFRQREAFRQVPPDRLLIETDAPDQPLPEDRTRFSATDGCGKPINHPANILAVYDFAAELFREPLEELSARIEENFRRLFKNVLRPAPAS